MSAVFETNLPGLKLLARGKVRDVYDLGDKLLIVSTDRLSAFDSVLPTPIPDKGRVLNGLSRFWFNFLGDSPRNHGHHQEQPVPGGHVHDRARAASLQGIFENNRPRCGFDHPTAANRPSGATASERFGSAMRGTGHDD